MRPPARVAASDSAHRRPSATGPVSREPAARAVPAAGGSLTRAERATSPPQRPLTRAGSGPLANPARATSGSTARAPAAAEEPSPGRPSSASIPPLRTGGVPVRPVTRSSAELSRTAPSASSSGALTRAIPSGSSASGVTPSSVRAGSGPLRTGGSLTRTTSPPSQTKEVAGSSTPSSVVGGSGVGRKTIPPNSAAPITPPSSSGSEGPAAFRKATTPKEIAASLERASKASSPPSRSTAAVQESSSAVGRLPSHTPSARVTAPPGRIARTSAAASPPSRSEVTRSGPSRSIAPSSTTASRSAAAPSEVRRSPSPDHSSPAKSAVDSETKDSNSTDPPSANPAASLPTQAAATASEPVAAVAVVEEEKTPPTATPTIEIVKTVEADNDQEQALEALEALGKEEPDVDELEESRIPEVEVGGRVRAFADFVPTRPFHLALQEGDEVEVLQKHETGWWTGSLQRRIGLFPANFTEAAPTLVAAVEDTTKSPALGRTRAVTSAIGASSMEFLPLSHEERLHSATKDRVAGPKKTRKGRPSSIYRGAVTDPHSAAAAGRPLECTPSFEKDNGSSGGNSMLTAHSSPDDSRPRRPTMIGRPMLPAMGASAVQLRPPTATASAQPSSPSAAAQNGGIDRSRRATISPGMMNAMGSRSMVLPARAPPPAGRVPLVSIPTRPARPQ